MLARTAAVQVFGGYLLRTAYEAAWTTAVDLLDDAQGAAGACGTAAHMAAVQLSRVSEVHFLLPVEVGNMLEISSRPVFTGDDGALIVITECKVKDHRAARGFRPTNRQEGPAARGRPAAAPAACTRRAPLTKGGGVSVLPETSRVYTRHA